MRHKCFRLAAFVGIVMFPLCNALQAQSDSAGKIVFESYTFRTYDGKQYDAELGKLWVRENRNIRSSPLIQLSFVRLKSFSTAPGAPIIFLAGGPGVPSIAMAKVPVYFSLFQKLQEVADVIFLDQRGCGLSVPNLECSNELRTANMFENEKNWLNSLERMSKSCADYWRSKGVDLAAYTSEASADDLEDLRRALHVSKISLIGHSYGTYLAQVAIRNHEDTIEKIVLANTDVPGDFLASPAVWDILIKKLSYYAKADSSINKIIPDFEQMYRNVLSTLEKKPVVVNVMDYEKKKSVELKVGKIGVQWIVRNFMADARTYAKLPAFIYTIANGDYSLLAKELEPLYNGASRSIMATAIDCSIGWSVASRLETDNQIQGSLFSNVNLQWSGKLCELIGIKRAGAETKTSLFSTIPALFISGTLDTNTPPFQAEKVRWGFPNSYHLIIENGGHETLPSKDVQAVVVDFFKGMDIRDRSVRFAVPDFVNPLQLKTMALERSH